MYLKYGHFSNVHSLKHDSMDTSDFHTKCTQEVNAQSCLGEFVPKFRFIYIHVCKMYKTLSLVVFIIQWTLVIRSSLGPEKFACSNETLLYQGYKNNTIQRKSENRDCQNYLVLMKVFFKYFFLH